MPYSSRPIDCCKGRSEPVTENSDAPPPRRCIPALPDDRARRVAELRTALAGAAPTFQARVRRGGEGSRP
jgi:hypothetical protein